MDKAEIVEPEYGTFTDERDGQTYRTVKMPDGRVWMAQNLNYKPESGNSWCYNDDESMGEKYGRLYDWKTAKIACPKGWHLPSNQEWKNLVEAVGGEDAAGNRLKSKSGWADGYTGGWFNGTDDYGFSALPGGTRRADPLEILTDHRGRILPGDTRIGFAGLVAEFLLAGKSGIWWTATEDGDGSGYAKCFSVDYNKDAVEWGFDDICVGFSVRCVAN
jgi:uncharacterized protein (TIGR02145 family)